MDGLLEQFLIEARELVQQASDDLLALERSPEDSKRLDSAFRAVHTLKGSVGLFDLAPMGEALHAGEDLLGAIRARQIPGDRTAIDALVQLIAQTERWINTIEASGILPSDAFDEARQLAQSMRALLPMAKPAAEGPDDDPAWARAWMSELPTSDPDPEGRPLQAIRYTPHPDCFFAGDDPLALFRSVPNLVALRIRPVKPWGEIGDLNPFSSNLVIEALTRGSRADVRALFRFVPDQVSFHEVPAAEEGPHAAKTASKPSGPSGPLRSGATGASILRVDARRIDRLVDLVGELVVANNGLGLVAERASHGATDREVVSGLISSHAIIERLAADMHAAVMGVRLLPLREALRSLPLAIRDLSARLGKEVDFTMQGEDIEADKSVVEGLHEPLLHLIRNALDHGIETPEGRRSAGKPARGRVELTARRDGDKVLVEVNDDGRGIDADAVRRVARERGVLSGETIDAMSPADVIGLVFEPGFSTAGDVTDISGRGVGMDAVRVAVERLGGRIGMASEPGRGTTISLTLPVTVVLTRIMEVRAGGQTFGVPIDAIEETTRLSSDRILPVGEGRAFVFRGRTLPLLHLSDLLGREASPSGKDVRVMLIRAGHDLVGVAVDGFGERMDVMLRPLAGLLAGIPGYVGTALMGDGSVLMIVDLAGLIG